MAGLLVAGAAAFPASAQSQGSIGATSNGSIAIEATVPTRIRISGLEDVDFSSQEPTSEATAAQNVCVWTNRRDNGYQITVTGSGAANAFTLENATNANDTVPYAVEWAGTANQTSGEALSPGTAATGFTAGGNNPNCTGGEGESLIIKITETNLQAMFGSEAYSGTLNLVVAPN